MNNPFPTVIVLQAEAAADCLLAEQADAVTAFQAIVRGALTGIRALHFPLGSPATGYDLEDIEGHLAEWLEAETNAEFLEAWALDVVRGLEAA
jgi:hypothetical protein